jgi:putative hydrolase of the HAD superfamily
MHKTAIIFDLDNTIYSVQSIGEILFADLFELIRQNGSHEKDFEEIRKDIMRRPFQLVAERFGFNEELTRKGIEHLKEITYLDKIEPFDDYTFTKTIQADKFLVTTGFLKLQQSKIAGMKITNDFNEIYIIDPLESSQTKKDVFADIMQKHGYNKTEVLVIGDDLHSEIKAAQELGIDVVLYDKLNVHSNVISIARISDFKQLIPFLK